MQKTFLLGVGGHKCGTTWLHDYLSRSPQSQMGIFKEYHVFDALHLDNATIFYDRRLEEARKALANPAYRFDADPKLWKSLTFLADVQEYFDYFQTLLRKPRFLLTGDITPSYSGLSIEILRFIRQQILKRDLRIRVIFLMRDPVERSWSAVRMRRRGQLRDNPDLNFATSEDEDLAALFQSKNFTLRASYDSTIANLREVFAPEELYFGFYETLFNISEVQKICNFLGLDYSAPDFEVQKNVSPKSAEISDAVRIAVRTAYAGSYAAAAAIYRKGPLREIWPSATILDSSL